VLKLEIDQTTRERIERLVSEEYRINHLPVLTDADHRRLRAIHVELDQYWDVLRLRRLRRQAG
jgi:hypothetical protein